MEHWVFVEESIVIAGFTFYWITQKVAEVWAEPDPEPETEAGDRVLTSRPPRRHDILGG